MARAALGTARRVRRFKEVKKEARRTRTGGRKKNRGVSLDRDGPSTRPASSIGRNKGGAAQVAVVVKISSESGMGAVTQT
jgi:hypothetical protein